MNEHVESKIRTRKQQTEENSATIERIVEGLVQKYTRDLDGYLAEIKKKLNSSNELSDGEIEDLTLRVPIYLYFLSDGVEVLGLQGDTARAIKMEEYNNYYLKSDGTIKDKSHEAELNTLPEYLLEVAYIRAYKTIKTKLDIADSVCSSARKLLSKRIQNNELKRMEGTRNGER